MKRSKKSKTRVLSSTFEYNINNIPTKIDSVKISKNVTQFKVKSAIFEPFTIAVDTRNNSIVNKDSDFVGSVKKSQTPKISSVTKNGVLIPIDKLSKLKSQINQLAKSQPIVNYKYFAHSLIAISICVSISYGIPKIIQAATNYGHQGVLDEIARVDAHERIKYADAIFGLAILVPVAYITTISGAIAVIGAAAAIYAAK